MKTLKKRWLLIFSSVFIYILPLLLIAEKMITVKHTDKNITFSFVGFILGMIYIAFISKKAKVKLNEIKRSSFKIFVLGLLNIVPFATVGFLIFLVKNALAGFDMTVWYVCISMVIGYLIQAVEYQINKNYIYELETDEEAKRSADVEIKKRKRLKDAGYE